MGKKEKFARITIRMPRSLHLRLDSVLKKENQLRRILGKKEISQNDFLVELIEKGLLEREREIMRAQEDRIRQMEKEVMKFVNSLRNLELASLLGYDEGLKFERKEF